MYKEPKYMFCKGFPRGGMLYGLHKHEINRIMILVEGQKDVMSLWQKGFKNVAGIMGSDLTVKQATILMKYADTVLLCLDADDVGRKKADMEIIFRYKKNLPS
jgi:DNA primase